MGQPGRCHLGSTDVILSDLGMKNKGLNKLNRRMQICLETPITFLIKSHKKHMLTIFFTDDVISKMSLLCYDGVM